MPTARKDSFLTQVKSLLQLPGARYKAAQAAQRARNVEVRLDVRNAINAMRKAGINIRPRSFKKGGKIKRAGLAKLHKGEVVLTKKQAGIFHKVARKMSNIKV